MSIALFGVKINGDADNTYIPIATEDAFRNVWLPVSRQYGLKWINAFQGGHSFTREDIRDILGDLRQLKEIVGQEEGEEQVLSRVNSLIEFLKQLEAREGEEIEFSIG